MRRARANAAAVSTYNSRLEMTTSLSFQIRRHDALPGSWTISGTKADVSSYAINGAARR
jgi:hypothetical protein